MTDTTAPQVMLPTHELDDMADTTESDDYIPDFLRRPACELEILIPARNEALRLPATLFNTIRYLESQPYSASVVVIDNGSADRTTDLVARRWSDRVPVYLTGCADQGKGAAVRRGFLTSRALFAGYMDADLATPIETLDLVLPLLEGGWQAVVGSRHISGASFAKKQAVHRSLGGMVFRAAAHRILPDIADTQCGFKFFAGDLVRSVVTDLRIHGFAFDVELLHAITAMGVPVKEVPVVWSDADGSTLNAVRDGTRAIADVLRLSRDRVALCPR